MTFPTGEFKVDIHPELGGSTWVLVGAGKSGKTTLLKYILKMYYLDHIKTFFTMNPQAEIYKTLKEDITVSPVYFPELIREASQINKINENKFQFLFVSDDYVDTKIKNDKEVEKCMTIHRNANISSIWSFQGRTLVSAIGRANANYVAVLRQQTPQQWEQVIKEFLNSYLPLHLTMNQKIQYCTKATENHQFFFIDNIDSKCYLTKLKPWQVEISKSGDD